jgi:branched-chain amino acid transport system permease protein
MPSERWLAWICLLSAVLVMIVLANLNRSRVGRSFRAVRDDEIAASLAGVNVARTQVLAFVVSSACAGLAGSLLALGTTIVNPAEFTIALSLSLLAGLVIGGQGSLAGAWWGALVLVLVPRWSTTVSNALGLGSGVRSNLALMIYGVVLIVVMILAPSGIDGGVRRILGLGRLPRGRLGPAVRAGRTGVGSSRARGAPVPGQTTTQQGGAHDL